MTRAYQGRQREFTVASLSLPDRRFFSALSGVLCFWRFTCQEALPHGVSLLPGGVFAVFSGLNQKFPDEAVI